ncbi:MAG: hypothetical protein GXP22_10015 [Gammaproteobacteria bacterium]|nr:hypothetical protein [Gammaproteobacteria bacterium]
MDTQILQNNIERMEKLAVRLNESVKRIDAIMPLDPEIFDPDQVDSDELLFLDAFRIRFSDLQDVIGHTIFYMVALYDLDESPAQRLSTRERIHLMERKSLIDASEWNELREIRNGFAHEYPDASSEKAEALNAAWRYSSKLIVLSKKLKAYLCG